MAVVDARPRQAAMTVRTHAEMLCSAAADALRLRAAYDAYLAALLDGDVWSADRPDGLRIPWRQAAAAAAKPEWGAALTSSGLYLFGTGEGAPIYIGMTTGKLRSRLWRRYLRGTRCQCQLAADYADVLREKGIDAFPAAIRDWYRKSFGSATARLVGAKRFADAGIDGIWFTALPINDPATVKRVEAALIPVAAAWNRARGYGPLINVQHA